MTRVGRQRALGEVPNGIVRALPAVLQSRLQSVDLGPAFLEREVAEHVVERPILEEQHDDVLDRIQAHVHLRLTLCDGLLSVTRAHILAHEQLRHGRRYWLSRDRLEVREPR